MTQTPLQTLGTCETCTVLRTVVVKTFRGQHFKLLPSLNSILCWVATVSYSETPFKEYKRLISSETLLTLSKAVIS
jgi:hypothetical protein